MRTFVRLKSPLIPLLFASAGPAAVPAGTVNQQRDAGAHIVTKPHAPERGIGESERRKKGVARASEAVGLKRIPRVILVPANH